MLAPDPRMWQKAGRFATIGLEMAIAMAICTLGGEWLDTYFDTAPTFLNAGVFVGIAYTFFAFARLIKAAKAQERASEDVDFPPPP